MPSLIGSKCSLCYSLCSCIQTERGQVEKNAFGDQIASKMGISAICATHTAPYVCSISCREADSVRMYTLLNSCALGLTHSTTRGFSSLLGQEQKVNRPQELSKFITLMKIQRDGGDMETNSC